MKSAGAGEDQIEKTEEDKWVIDKIRAEQGKLKDLPAAGSGKDIRHGHDLYGIGSLSAHMGRSCRPHYGLIVSKPRIGFRLGQPDGLT